jgi:hypothetical protein
MSIELSPEERDLLLQLVDSALREIGPEIRHTTTRDYRDDLKEQRRALRSLYQVLSGGPPAEPELSGLVGTA